MILQTFFMDKILKIWNDLAEIEAYKPTSINCTNLNVFCEMTGKEISDIIKSMATKSCESDAVPTWLFKAIFGRIYWTKYKHYEQIIATRNIC